VNLSCIHWCTTKTMSCVLYFQTALGLLELIGVQNIPAEEDSYEFLRSIKDVSMIPSLVMALLSSRVVVFWLLNVILVICVIQATYQLSRDKGKVRVSQVSFTSCSFLFLH